MRRAKKKVKRTKLGLELADNETCMMAANDFRRALELAGVEFIDENGGPGSDCVKVSG